MLSSIIITSILLIFTVQTETPLFEFGNFQSASSIAYSDAGYFYITDEEANEITKFDTLGKVIISIGGFGSGEETFDSPSHVFASTLNIYLCDKNNDRIVFMDKDLNYLSELRSPENEEEQFAYPVAAGVSYQGDLFILDSDNGRILKYDLNGNYLFQIGNFDAGEYYLTYPEDLTITNGGDLVVLDENKLQFFDQFGNGLRSLKTPATLKGINFSDGKLLMIGKDTIYILSFTNNSLNLKKWQIPSSAENVKDAAIVNNKIYLLTKYSVQVYKFH